MRGRARERAPERDGEDGQGGGGRLARGMRTRRAVLGDAYVDRAISGTTPFNEAFQKFITGAAWADVWSRPGLDRRTRSCITLAALAALSQEHELAIHVRAARRNGVTADEIAEVLLHTAIYAGVPAANRAFAVAAQALGELQERQESQGTQKTREIPEPSPRGAPGKRDKSKPRR